MGEAGSEWDTAHDARATGLRSDNAILFSFLVLGGPGWFPVVLLLRLRLNLIGFCEPSYDTFRRGIAGLGRRPVAWGEDDESHEGMEGGRSIPAGAGRVRRICDDLYSVY